jgi:hypothetical protein
LWRNNNRLGSGIRCIPNLPANPTRIALENACPSLCAKFKMELIIASTIYPKEQTKYSMGNAHEAH